MSDNSSNNSRIAKNTLFLYLRMILVLVVSLYTTRVVLNALGVVDYGINNVVAGFVSMFAFLNTSMSNGIQRFYNFKLGSEGEEAFTKVYNMAMLIQLLLAAIVLILLETVGLWYLNNKMVIPADRMMTARWIYQFSVISLVLVIMQIPYSAAIMAHERMNYYAYVSIIEVALKLGFAFLLPHVKSDRLFVYGCYSLGVSVLNFLLYFCYSKKNFKSIRLQKGFHKDLFRNMLSFSGWNIFGTFAYMIKGQGLNVLLNAFFGPVVNAARGISGMIGNAIQGFQSNIVISFRPQLVQSYAEGNLDRVRNMMFSLSKISFIMLFMLSMPVMIELPYILHLWLGDVVPEYTIQFTTLMLINMIVSSLNTPLTQVVHATGKMKKYQICTSVVVCLVLPFSWIILRMGGSPVIVYIISLFIVAINQVVCLIVLKMIFPYSIKEYLIKVIVPCLILSVTATAIPLIIHLLINPSFFRLAVVALIGVIGTVYFTYIIVLNNSEKRLVKQMIVKIKNNRKY